MKVGRSFGYELDFEDIKLPVKIRDIHKIERKNSIAISVFGYETRKIVQSTCQKNVAKKKHVDLLWIEKEGKSHHVLIKDFHTFMYYHTLHRGRKHFFRYCLQAFRTEKISKCRVKDSFKINGKQRIKMAEKDEYDRFKNNGRNIKSPFMIYADFESILAPEDNGKQNSNDSYPNKYQKHAACSYGHKLVCANDKFSKILKSYLDDDAAYNFNNNMVEESKYCCDVMEKKELLMTKEDDEDFENSTKCWIYDNVYVDGMLN